MQRLTPRIPMCPRSTSHRVEARDQDRHDCSGTQSSRHDLPYALRARLLCRIRRNYFDESDRQATEKRLVWRLEKLAIRSRYKPLLRRLYTYIFRRDDGETVSWDYYTPHLDVRLCGMIWPKSR